MVSDSMASTRLNELGYRADIIELQLAHTQSNTVRVAHNHERTFRRAKNYDARMVRLSDKT